LTGRGGSAPFNRRPGGNANHGWQPVAPTSAGHNFKGGAWGAPSPMRQRVREGAGSPPSAPRVRGATGAAPASLHYRACRVVKAAARKLAPASEGRKTDMQPPRRRGRGLSGISGGECQKMMHAAARAACRTQTGADKQRRPNMTPAPPRLTFPNPPERRRTLTLLDSTTRARRPRAKPRTVGPPPEAHGATPEEAHDDREPDKPATTPERKAGHPAAGNDCRLMERRTT
jgi:hypothetical protein